MMPKLLVSKAPGPGGHVMWSFLAFSIGNLWSKKVGSRDGCCVLLIF